MSVVRFWLPMLSILLMGSPIAAADRMQDALAGSHRAPVDVARDRYRHPAQTLQFFGVTPQMTIVEIWPGGGWYTDVLAAYLDGRLYAAHFDPRSPAGYFRNSREAFEKKIAAKPEIYRNVQMATFDPANNVLDIDDASADAVLTFRNVHNWLSSRSEPDAFELFYRVLKPGGVLGVVEHRARPGTDWVTMRDSGYVTEAYVINLAQRAGFVLEEKSEINANPADRKDYPNGVWTLPPTLRLGDLDRDKYLAIGESDRMTLRFRKPAQ